MKTYVAKSQMKPISLDVRQIKVMRKCVNSRIPLCEFVNVVKSTTFEGHDIWRDSQKWYYVQETTGDWQYFGSLYEAKRFIMDTCWH